MFRHDNMRDALCRELRRFPQVKATIEPRAENPQGAADQRRGDIKVHKDGTTWVLDVGVVCPGTRRHTSAGADTTPGVAAEEYAAVRGDQERQIRGPAQLRAFHCQDGGQG